DDDGLGIEPNNLKAINSLIVYRTFRYGRNLDVILTDQRTFSGPDATDVEGLEKIYDPTFNGMFSEPAMIALDAGRAFRGGKPAAPAAGAARPPSSPSATSASPIRARMERHARSSAPFRRNGSWTSSAGPRPPGRSGAIRWAPSTRGPTRETFPMG